MKPILIGLSLGLPHFSLCAVESEMRKKGVTVLLIDDHSELAAKQATERLLSEKMLMPAVPITASCNNSVDFYDDWKDAATHRPPFQGRIGSRTKRSRRWRTKGAFGKKP